MEVFFFVSLKEGFNEHPWNLWQVLNHSFWVISGRKVMRAREGAHVFCILPDHPLEVFWWHSAWVSSGLRNTAPQTWWLQITELYSLTVPEARNAKPRCGRAVLPRRCQVRILPAFSSFRWLPTFLDPWRHHSVLRPCGHRVSFSVCLPPCASLTRILSCAPGRPPQLKIFNLIILPETLFLNKVESTGSEN